MMYKMTFFLLRSNFKQQKPLQSQYIRLREAVETSDISSLCQRVLLIKMKWKTNINILEDLLDVLGY